MTKTHTKRVLAALTASLLSLSLLAACGGQDSAADASTQPDAGWLNGRLANMETFPESFFVDENGNIVGEPSFGSHDLAEWTSIVETALANLDQGA